jgi:hypothetical protein
MNVQQKIANLEKEIARLDLAGDPMQFRAHRLETDEEKRIAGGLAIKARCEADELRKELRTLKALSSVPHIRQLTGGGQMLVAIVALLLLTAHSYTSGRSAPPTRPKSCPWSGLC